MIYDYFLKFDSQELAYGFLYVSTTEEPIALISKFDNAEIADIGILYVPTETVLYTPDNIPYFAMQALSGYHINIRSTIPLEIDPNYLTTPATPQIMFAPYIEAVPDSITKVQAMRAMKQAGIWNAFIALINTNQDAKDEWDLAQVLERNNVFVIAMSSQINLTPEQIDQLFIEGAKL